MISRRPDLNFANVPFHWAKVPEFSTDLNASSPIASQTEPYLNTVMATIRKDMPDGALRDEIDIFIKQEATHYATHNRFNSELYKRGYAAVRAIEMELRADFQKLLKEKSLHFNAAYCAGFENLALFLCKYIFSKGQKLFEGGEQTMCDLFLWHHAEEFEHRTVAHDAFAAVSGNYFRRVYGAFYSFFHLTKYKMKIKKIILEIDRETMTPEERKASRARERVLNSELAKYVLPRMLTVLIAYYDPAKAKMPSIVRATLARFEPAPT